MHAVCSTSYADVLLALLAPYAPHKRKCKHSIISFVRSFCFLFLSLSLQLRHATSLCKLWSAGWLTDWLGKCIYDGKLDGHFKWTHTNTRTRILCERRTVMHTHTYRWIAKRHAQASECSCFMCVYVCARVGTSRRSLEKRKCMQILHDNSINGESKVHATRSYILSVKRTFLCKHNQQYFDFYSCRLRLRATVCVLLMILVNFLCWIRLKILIVLRDQHIV